VLEDFTKAMGMVLPTGDEAYLTADAQYEWLKASLNIPAIAYGDIMRLLEAWIMGVPATEVCLLAIHLSLVAPTVIFLICCLRAGYCPAPVFLPRL
jgi:quinol-cytochrome oxidoreductase complex cytochrome b subunit